MLGSALEHTHNGRTSHVIDSYTSPYYLPSSTVILQQSTLFSMLGSALEHTHNGRTSHVVHVTLLSSVKHRYSAAVYPILHAGISSGAHTQRRDITRRTRHPIIFRQAPLFCSSLPYSPCWDQLWSTHTTAGHHTSYTSPYYLPSSTVILQQSTLFSMLGSALEHTHNGRTSHVVHVTLLPSVKHRYSAAVYPILHAGISSGAHTQRPDITRRTHHPIIFRQAPLFCSSLPYSPCWDQLWSTHTTAGHHTSYTSPYYLPSSTVILQQSTLFSMLGSALEHTQQQDILPYTSP